VTVAAPALLGDWLREQAGRDRVENGLVHPYYGDVGRVLLGAWDAERAIERRGLSGYLAQAGENLRTFGRVWQRVAEGYGKTGAPALIDGRSERIKQLAALPEGPASASLLSAEIQRQLRPAFSEGRSTLVRVTQATDGKLLSVELVSPSMDAEVDRAAVAGVRAAAEKLPMPPGEALEGRQKLVSLWEFELEISITPPLPIVAIEFDEVLGLSGVRLPLDRRIWKRVRLVAVM
jgi:TonB family protein